MHDLIIRNIQHLQDQQWVPTDLGITGGLISAIGDTGNQSRQEVDAQQSYALPGAIDLHVHFNEPGRTHWEGFASGSASGIAGGITTLVEMPLNSIPSTTNLEALKIKQAAIQQKSYTDYGLWGGLVPSNLADIDDLAQAGVLGFKAFMSPSGTDDFSNSDTHTLAEGMKRIAPTGRRLALHAEDPQVLDNICLASQKSAQDWSASRPIQAELSAVSIAIELSQNTQCPITIVHVSATPVLELIAQAKAAGIDIIAETCPHYLLLDHDMADHIGVQAKCAPPLRSPATVSKLWQSLQDGLIDTIGSDHSPAPSDLKEGKSFFQAWGGISGIQHGLPLLLDRHGIDNAPWVERLMQCAASTPAQLIALKNKGKLQIGYHADISLYRRLPTSHTIQTEQLHYRHRHSAYQGFSSQLALDSVYLRGQAVLHHGQFNQAPQGQYIPWQAPS